MNESLKPAPCKICGRQGKYIVTLHVSGEKKATMWLCDYHKLKEVNYDNYPDNLESCYEISEPQSSILII